MVSPGWCSADLHPRNASVACWRPPALCSAQLCDSGCAAPDLACEVLKCTKAGARAGMHPEAPSLPRCPQVLHCDRDLLHPLREEEARTHKLKRLIAKPNSYFLDVKCPTIGCCTM